MERTLLLFLLEVTAKATTIVAVAALVCWLLRHASAALRHFIWAIALAGILLLPALALLMPDWRVALLPAALGVARDADPAVPLFDARLPARSEAEGQRSPSATPRHSEATATPADSFSRSAAAATESGRPIASQAITDRAIADLPIASSHQPITQSADRQMTSFLLLVLWIAGAMVALGRLLAGHAHLWWMERHADPITDPGWLELARRVADQLRLAAPRARGTARTSAIRLLRCRRPTMPVCWGVRRPLLLLPSDADSWTVERRRIVLLHELAHAKRGDCLTQLLAQTAIALHWFNPFVWLAVRLLRTERERACDDLVLASGADAPDYADHLLDIARAFRTAGCPSWAALAMARPSQLEGRLLAILDRHRDRRALTRRACAAAATLTLAMVGTLAAVQPEPAPPEDGRSSSQAAVRSRPQPPPAAGAGAPTAPVLARDAQPLPAPPPHPLIAPHIGMPDPIELENLELEIEGLVEGVEGVSVGIGEGVGSGIPGGITGGVIGGVPGVPPIDPIEIDTIAVDPALAVDAEAIAVHALEQATAKIADADHGREADPKIVAALVSALKDQNVDVRRQAASTLAHLRSPQALDAMIAATTDADKDVREFAVHAISRHRSDAVTQALVRALKDNDAAVRRAAMHGVSRLRDPKYIDVFVDAFKSGDPEVRKLAVHTLSGLRDARAVPALVMALKDADAEVRQAAIHGVARRRDPQYLDVLTAALKDADPEVRQAAAYGLAGMRDARAVPGLIMALQDSSAEVRQHAAHALGRIGDARAVDPLVAALKDTEEEVRQTVVHALGQIGRRAGARDRE
jgi:HEAT repeat protein/beta-lactamase regulating signal transducer with metallopeptidase domain